MKLFVSGLINIETTVAVRGFPIPYYPIDYPFFGIGSAVSGVGYNVAKALKTLGDEISLCALIGKDAEARRILNQLERDGIDPGHVDPCLESTPVSVVLYDRDGRRQIYCDLKDIQERRLDPVQAGTAWKDCDAAVLCNIGFNRSLIREARSAGVLTATDVHVLGSIDDDYNRDFMQNADILFLSDEALPCRAEDFIRAIADRYQNRIVVIGMGAQGAMLLDAAVGEIRRIPAWRPERIVNTVGAGDALFSAFLHFYLKTKDTAAALQRAVVFAGIKIGVSGASESFSTEAETESIARDLCLES